MTLIEMVIAISITAIIAGAVAVFVSRPVESYMDASRRAEMTDIADTALRRITRDLRTALPNSIRITESPPGTFYLEYLQTSGGGRYRAELDNDAGTSDNILDFTAADTTFDVIGTMPTVAATDSIVVYNLASSGPLANAYEAAPNNNRESCANPCSSGNTITLSAAKQFPYPSPGKRFQVVQHPVTYVCQPGAPGTVRRIAGYAIQAAQPTDVAVAPLSSAPSNALLATDINTCSFAYIGGATQRSGVVSLSLEIRHQQTGEVIRLFQQAHVNNVP